MAEGLTISVDQNRTETIQGNETITIGKDRTERVRANETITIDKNRTETVQGNETVTVGMNRAQTVGLNEELTVDATRTLTIGAGEADRRRSSARFRSALAVDHRGQGPVDRCGGERDDVDRQEPLDQRGR